MRADVYHVVLLLHFVDSRREGGAPCLESHVTTPVSAASINADGDPSLIETDRGYTRLRRSLTLGETCRSPVEEHAHSWRKLDGFFRYTSGHRPRDGGGVSWRISTRRTASPGRACT